MRTQSKRNTWLVVDDEQLARKSAMSKGLSFVSLVRVSAEPTRRVITYKATDKRNATVTRNVRVSR
jgi:hypothetical protein